MGLAGPIDLDRMLSAIEVRVIAMTLCDLRVDGAIECGPFDVPTAHFVMAGAGVLSVGGNRLQLGAGAFALVPRGVRYGFAPDGPQHAVGGGAAVARVTLEPFSPIRAGTGAAAMAFACGAITATHSGVVDLLDAMFQPRVHRFGADDPIIQQFLRLAPELAAPRTGTGALVETLLRQCLVLWLRDMERAGETVAGLIPAAARRGLWRAMMAMAERPGAGHSLESLAAIAGMSRSAFSTQFAATFGTSPMRMLRGIRLRRAAELLATTHLPIDAIARDVGFANRSHFSRAFRAAHGATPARMRGGPE